MLLLISSYQVVKKQRTELLPVPAAWIAFPWVQANGLQHHWILRGKDVILFELKNVIKKDYLGGNNRNRKPVHLLENLNVLNLFSNQA